MPSTVARLVAGGVVVYRDGSHISLTRSHVVAAELGRQLGLSGPAG
ncbi:hypothetical protein [Nocardioides sp. B-3]|nr:hypothetical protein [Nocardioides sp. B-3]UUZ61447.1 hypothetical protein LP418_13280 [Nocardioides sp. B-3]